VAPPSGRSGNYSHRSLRSIRTIGSSNRKSIGSIGAVGRGFKHFLGSGPVRFFSSTWCNRGAPADLTNVGVVRLLQGDSYTLGVFGVVGVVSEPNSLRRTRPVCRWGQTHVSMCVRRLYGTIRTQTTNFPIIAHRKWCHQSTQDAISGR